MHHRVLAGREIADDVVRRVTTRTLDRADVDGGPHLEEVIHETIYTEQHRLSLYDAAPRSGADRAFVGWLRHELACANRERRRELIALVVERYVNEISGHFAPQVYAATTRCLPSALAAFMHGLAHGRAIGRREWFDIDDRVLIEGHVDALQRLATRGTVILAPTHVSNLDAVLLGFVIYRLGLPPFAYGAGLNLFSSALIGFFMRNLGAYTVDRQKTDPLYRAVLKEYTTVLLERGQPSLFFPGGTRSRSGAIEDHLKMGLLGTAPIAFRHGLEAQSAKPGIFVVPCTLSYPLVLESASLIDDYLRTEGGAHYIDIRDEFEHPRRWVDFLRGLAQLDLRVHVVIGEPLDCIGNPVDHQGRSRDPHGRVVDPSRYFTVRGHLAADDVRDAEYTRTLASRLMAAFRRDTVALPTHVLAASLFSRMRRDASTPDLFRLLRTLEPEAGVDQDVAQRDVAAILDRLRQLESKNAVRIAPEVRHSSPEAVIQRALATFASYHATPPVEQRGTRLQATDPKLLYYYGNRIEGLAS